MQDGPNKDVIVCKGRASHDTNN